ncbi:hypothetical protein Phou_073840 [Phytohabitans houttuyneae]|uniref:Uncharacterized protein n=1 Tax=Phytohabitans houttuyneae TaxID=1076126 RepID=A0A6V8KH78_9ACTN|nr:hypothetical protein Phou_073840 [Phytohabitans houttuyneae]
MAGQLVAQAHAVEDVVAEDERHRLVADEVRPDDERLRDALGPRLRRVAKVEAPLRAVAQQPLELRLVLGVVMIRISRIPAITSVVRG